MINITKPLVRKTRRPFMHYKRPIVVALEPPDLIKMWLKGTRTRSRSRSRNSSPSWPTGTPSRRPSEVA